MNFGSILRSNVSAQRQQNLFNFNPVVSKSYYGAESSGALHWSSDEADEHAKRYYEFCKKRKTDCDVIAQNTGFRVQDIRKIKDHIFFSKHKLDDGVIGYFDPSYDMAQSWQRLSENNGRRIEDNDIVMLNHEFFESTIEKVENLTYREAHDRADAIYHYVSEHEKEVTGYDGMVHRINRKRR